MLAPALQKLAKASFTITMTPQGEILDVKVGRETVEAVQSLPGAAQMGGMFSEEGLVKMMKQGSHSFPAEAVEKGSSWTTTAEAVLPQLGTMVSESKLTYAGPVQVGDKALEKIDLVVTTKLAAPADGGLANIKLKSQDATGTIYFDNAAGRLSHTELKQHMTMDVTFGGNNIEQVIEQTIKVRVKPFEL